MMKNVGKWIIKCGVIFAIVAIWFAIANAKDEVKEENACVSCEAKKRTILSSDPNILLRDEIKMMRMQLTNLMGFYSKERVDLLAEKKLLGIKIKKMQNKISIHTLGLTPPNPGDEWGGFTPDGKKIWITPDDPSK